MNQFYAVNMVLNAAFNEKNITYLLQCSLDLGVIIYDNTDDFYPKALDSAQAASLLLTLLQNNQRNSAYLTVKFEDTAFSLRLDSMDQNIRIIISDFNPPWKGLIDDITNAIDFARYIRLLLTICKDFPILELKTSRHY